MVQSDRLSVDEIGRLWGEETGQDAASVRDDLAAWLAESVKRTSPSRSPATGSDADQDDPSSDSVPTRLVDRPTLEAYCKERGQPMPEFWRGREELSPAGSGGDPEAAFEARSSWMRDNLKARLTEAPEVGDGPAESSPPPDRREPEGDTRSASARVQELIADLESAAERNAKLVAEAKASRTSPLMRPGEPTPVPVRTPMTMPEGVQAEAEDATGASADQESRPSLLPGREGRGLILFLAGLSVPLVALLFWGISELIRPAVNDGAAPEAERTQANAEPRPGGVGQQAAEPETAEPPAELSATQAEPGGIVLALTEDELLGAGPQTDPLPEAVELPAPVTAPPSDGLLVAEPEAPAVGQAPVAQSDPELARAQRDRRLAALVASARVVALERELAEARQRIADLVSEAVQAKQEPAAEPLDEASDGRQLAADAPPPGSLSTEAADQAPLDLVPVVPQEDLAQEQTAELAPDPAPPAPAEPATAPDVVPLENLLLEPSRHVGRDVVVTGSVLWLMRRYWLQLAGGQVTMLIDTTGVPEDDLEALNKAIVAAEFLVPVQARVTGTVEARDPDSHHLVASELVLVE